MNHTLSEVKKFKHDTVGKFQNLKELIDYINDNNLDHPDSQEILIEVRETFKKMVIATEKILSSGKSF